MAIPSVTKEWPFSLTSKAGPAVPVGRMGPPGPTAVRSADAAGIMTLK
jgi:hypothetical protein